jgi:hypothetical protein
LIERCPAVRLHLTFKATTNLELAARSELESDQLLSSATKASAERQRRGWPAKAGEMAA